MNAELVKSAAAGDRAALDELALIADVDPAALTDHLESLYAQGLLWPPTLYRGASAELVRKVVGDVDAARTTGDLRLNHLLLVAAHVRDPGGEQALRRWQASPPEGAASLHAPPLAYALEAGWTLAPDGTRRELCGPVSHRLVVARAQQRVDPPVCPWCTSPMWLVADLDVDDPAVGEALSHTAWRGRLRIETCALCACYGPVRSQVGPNGTATWWAGNTRPEYLPAGLGPEEPPAVLLLVGTRRASPFQASAWDAGGSTLGGHPDWIQHAEHVACPGCGQAMDYVGLVGGADVEEWGEGAYYLHLHAPCGFAAVNYQQS